jgi:hypothetical protein
MAHKWNKRKKKTVLRISLGSDQGRSRCLVAFSKRSSAREPDEETNGLIAALGARGHSAAVQMIESAAESEIGPKRIAAAKALAVVAGLATVVLGIATGNWPVVVIAAAVMSGAGLLAAVADLRETEARCEAARQNQTSAGIEPGRDVEPGIKERLASIKTYYARLESEAEDGGRFRELVSAEDEPGCHRLH